MVEENIGSAEPSLEDKKRTPEVKENSSTGEEVNSEDVVEKLRGAFEFVKKKRMSLLLLFLLIIPFLFGLSARINATNLSFAEEISLDMVNKAVFQQVSSGVPNDFTSERRSAIIQQNVQDYIKKNRAEYEIAWARLEKKVKDQYQDPTGQTYLLEIDPYVWLHKSENVLQYGHVGDTKKEKCYSNGKCEITAYDSLMLAPDGDNVAINLFPYIITYVYQFLNLFIANLSLLTVMFYLPAFLAALSVIPTFFITRRLSKNDYVSFVAALLIAVHHAFIQRTVAGAADTDAFSVLFPLCIWWLLLIAMDIKTKKWLAITFASLAGLGTGMYAITWGGWWFIFDAFVIAFIIYLVYHLLLQIRKKEALVRVFKRMQVKCTMLVMVFYIITTGLFVTLFTRFLIFSLVVSNLFGTIGGLTAATGKGIWPNVYTTVQELASLGLKVSLEKIGILLVIFTGVGIVLALHSNSRKKFTWAVFSAVWYSVLILLRSFFSSKFFLILLGLPFAVSILALLKEKREQNIFTGVFLAVWFGGMVFASTTAQRFVVVLIPVLAVGSAITLVYIYKLLSPLAEKHLSLPPLIFQPLFVAIAIMLIVFPVSGASNGDIRPIFDDGWYATLEKIDAESAPDAIIASWWDFGHFFKAIGNRKVIFDGGTQNRPQAHWMSKILINDDEDQAIAILRMLACGGNNAFDLLNEELKDTARSVNLLYTLFEKDKEEGLAILQRVTSEEKAKAISQRLYCDPPETYFIVSQDMLNKMHALTKFGNWKFDRAKVWNDVKGKSQKEMILHLKKDLNYTSEEARQTARDLLKISSKDVVSTWITTVGGFGSDFGLCQDHLEKNTSYLCILKERGKQVVIDLDKKTKQAVVKNTPPRPVQSVIWVDADNTLHETFNPTSTLNSSLVLINSSQGMLVRFANPAVKNSLITNLFFYDAPGFSHFEKFDEQEPTSLRGTIKTWKVIWDPNKKKKGD